MSPLHRREWLVRNTKLLAVGWMLGTSALSARTLHELKSQRQGRHGLTSDLVVIGGGLGGCAAALAALEAGLRVLLTEPTDWIGGQLTSQAVPPDENRWIETHGCTRRYRRLREGIRNYYRRNYPLLPDVAERAELNPGDGFVSRLCHEPRVALATLESMLSPHLSSGRLTLLLEHSPIEVETQADRVRSVLCRNHRTGHFIALDALHFIDATELGDLLPLARIEHVTGAEARAEHHELHATEKPHPATQQAFTMCFPVEHIRGEDHRISKPTDYDFWKDYLPRLRPAWPGKLLRLTYSNPQNLQPRTVGFDPTQESTGDSTNLWRYRRLARQSMFTAGTYRGDISLINWPQNDYLLGNLVGVTEEEAKRHIRRAKDLSLSLLYWLQTEAPRPDGGQGWQGLRLRGDLVGTEDGLAKAPYIRESRRIRAVLTVTESHCGREARALETGKKESEVKAMSYPDSVGIGHYNIDLHPSTTGENYIDVPSLPFEIPLGALLPQRMKNLVAGCKNLGVTHITNGCYRLHPVEWNIGEAAGALVAFVHQRKADLHAVREKPELLDEFQKQLTAQGIPLRWPG